MEHGGGWIGFHVAGYNDKDTHWPWFVQFLGGGVFYTNNWPVLPAKLNVDDRVHPVTKGLPATYESPANEWYLWKPSPRLNKDVRVLLTLDPSNYPIGKRTSSPKAIFRWWGPTKNTGCWTSKLATDQSIKAH